MFYLHYSSTGSPFFHLGMLMIAEIKLDLRTCKYALGFGTHIIYIWPRLENMENLWKQMTV